MKLRLKDFSIFDQVLIALSLVLVGFLLIDPFMVERANALQPGARKVFRAITDIGRSNWMLIPTGTAVALALVLQKRDAGFRNSPAYGLIASTIGFVFVSIGGAGLIATLVKNILGRARPKLFETMGPFDFKLFAFTPDYASFPSGHAANIFAFATVIAITVATRQSAALHHRCVDCGEQGSTRRALLYRCRVRRDSRHDGSVLRARPICRAPLVVRTHAGRRLPHQRAPNSALARLGALQTGPSQCATFRRQRPKLAGLRRPLTSMRGPVRLPISIKTSAVEGSQTGVEVP
jgi:membrane-associated phospholipid phosphatase